MRTVALAALELSFDISTNVDRILCISETADAAAEA